MKRYRITQVLIIVALLLAYELATRLGLLDPYTFIPLSDMVAKLAENLTDPSFLGTHLWVTTLEMLLSFLGATLLGIPIGVLLWHSEFLYHSMQPYLLLFYAVPFFAVYPILVSIFGLGLFTVVLVGVLLSMPAIIVNTALGFRGTREVLITVGQSFNLPFRKLLLHIFFPAAWPHIFTGLRLAVAYSIIGVVATEFILSDRGIGYTISYAYNNFDLESMYASVLLIVIFAVLIISILGYFESNLYKQSYDE